MSTLQENEKQNVRPGASGNKNFIKDNQTSLSFIAGGIVVLLLLFFGYQRFYLAPRAEKASNEMFKAEQYAAADSTQRAIAGDGSYPGFEQIAQEYSNTKSANIANAYLGGLYLQEGKFQEAVDALEKYSNTGSVVLDPLITGLLGDAYSELQDYKKAASQYQKAADQSRNDFTPPLFLKKLGLVNEAQNDFSAALKAYEKIKKQYPSSYEAAQVDGYIARAKAHL